VQLLKNFEQLARRIPVFLVYIGRDFPIAVIPLLHIPVPKRIAPRKPLKVPGKGALSESLKLRPGAIDVLSLGPGQRKPSTLLLSFQIQEDVDDTVRAIPQQLVGILDGLGREKGFRASADSQLVPNTFGSYWGEPFSWSAIGCHVDRLRTAASGVGQEVRAETRAGFMGLSGGEA